jgi:hypothetical protein
MGIQQTGEVWYFASLFYDAFSVFRIYSVYYRVINEKNDDDGE